MSYTPPAGTVADLVFRGPYSAPHGTEANLVFGYEYVSPPWVACSSTVVFVSEALAAATVAISSSSTLSIPNADRSISLQTGSTFEFVSYNPYVTIETGSITGFYSGATKLITLDFSGSSTLAFEFFFSADIHGASIADFVGSSTSETATAQRAKTRAAFCGEYEAPVKVYSNGKSRVSFAAQAVCSSAGLVSGKSLSSFSGNGVNQAAATVNGYSAHSFFGSSVFGGDVSTESVSVVGFAGQTGKPSAFSALGASSGAFVSYYSFSLLNQPVDPDCVVYVRQEHKVIHVIQ